VGAAEFLMPAFAYNPAFLYDNTANCRIRLNRADASPGEPQRGLHKSLVLPIH